MCVRKCVCACALYEEFTMCAFLHDMISDRLPKPSFSFPPVLSATAVLTCFLCRSNSNNRTKDESIQFANIWNVLDQKHGGWAPEQHSLSPSRVC